MCQLRLQELDVKVGDIIVCVSEDSEMCTSGIEYEVKQAEDGKLGIMTDCGFIATTSTSLFTPLELLNDVKVLVLKPNPMTSQSLSLASTVPPKRPQVAEVISNDNFKSFENEIRAS